MTKETSLTFTNQDDGTMIELIVGSGSGTAILLVSDINTVGDEEIVTDICEIALSKRDLVRLSNFITGELDNV